MLIDGREKGTLCFHKRRDNPQFGFMRKFRKLGRGEHTVRLVVNTPRGDRRFALIDSFRIAGQAG